MNVSMAASRSTQARGCLMLELPRLMVLKTDGSDETRVLVLVHKEVREAATPRAVCWEEQFPLPGL